MESLSKFCIALLTMLYLGFIFIVIYKFDLFLKFYFQMFLFFNQCLIFQSFDLFSIFYYTINKLNQTSLRNLVQNLILAQMSIKNIRSNNLTSKTINSLTSQSQKNCPTLPNHQHNHQHNHNHNNYPLQNQQQTHYSYQSKLGQLALINKDKENYLHKIFSQKENKKLRHQEDRYHKYILDQMNFKNKLLSVVLLQKVFSQNYRANSIKRQFFNLINISISSVQGQKFQIQTQKRQQLSLLPLFTKTLREHFVGISNLTVFLSRKMKENFNMVFIYSQKKIKYTKVLRRAFNISIDYQQQHLKDSFLKLRLLKVLYNSSAVSLDLCIKNQPKDQLKQFRKFPSKHTIHNPSKQNSFIFSQNQLSSINHCHETQSADIDSSIYIIEGINQKSKHEINENNLTKDLKQKVDLKSKSKSKSKAKSHKNINKNTNTNIMQNQIQIQMQANYSQTYKQMQRKTQIQMQMQKNNAKQMKMKMNMKMKKINQIDLQFQKQETQLLQQAFPLHSFQKQKQKDLYEKDLLSINKITNNNHHQRSCRQRLSLKHLENVLQNKGLYPEDIEYMELMKSIQKFKTESQMMRSLLIQKNNELKCKEEQIKSIRLLYQTKLQKIYDQINSNAEKQMIKSFQDNLDKQKSNTSSYYQQIETAIIGDRNFYQSSKNSKKPHGNSRIITEELIQKYMKEVFQLRQKMDIARQLCEQFQPDYKTQQGQILHQIINLLTPEERLNMMVD